MRGCLRYSSGWPAEGRLAHVLNHFDVILIRPANSPDVRPYRLSSLSCFAKSIYLDDRCSRSWIWWFEMYMLREAKRETGAELQFPSLWMERTVDFLFGATCQIVIFLCAVWIVAVLIKHPNVWIRQLAVATVYLGCALLVKMV